MPRLSLLLSRSRWLRSGAPVTAGLAAVALVAVARPSAPAPFAELRRWGYDALQRAAPRPDADAVKLGSGVVVVDLDEASLAREGQWPWPRSTVAHLIGRLQDAGAVAIGLDAVFAESDRSSPAALAPLWSRQYGLSVTGAGSTLPDYDADLRATLARGRVVTGYVLLPGANGRAPAVANGVTLVGDGAVPALYDYGGAVPNLAAFDEASAGQGFFSLPSVGTDETVRQLPLFASLNGSIVPSLTAEALRVAQGDDAELVLRAERGGGLAGGLTGYTARVGELTVPIAPDGAMRLRFGAHDPARTLPAHRVLEGDGADLRRVVSGRIVLVGTSALGLADLRPTPLRSFEPGVYIHAAAVEQALAGDVLTRAFWLPRAELQFGCLLGLAVAIAVAWRGARAGIVAFAAGAGLSACVALLCFTRLHLLVDASLPILTGAAALVLALVARQLVTERRARHLRTAFGQYLSPQLVDALARDPDRLKLGGEERDMTFLFTDLEGFTAFAESVSPALLVSTLNRYLDGVCALVLDHGGTIDKIVGDAVHVMFNAPLDQPDHALRAVHCALAIDGFAEGFARAAEAETDIGRAFGTTRIGVNTGRAVVGNFGGARRFDYTAHGDAINTAARLEAANKRLGTRICVSRQTVAAIGAGSDVGFRPIGALGLKGKAVRVEVFAPAAAGSPERGWADRYADAFERLSRGDADGPEAVLALLAQFPDDPLLRFHAERIERGMRGTEVSLQAA